MLRNRLGDTWAETEGINLQLASSKSRFYVFRDMVVVYLKKLTTLHFVFDENSRSRFNKSQYIEWYRHTPKTKEPRRDKTGLRGFRPGPTQTGLYKLRKELEA